MQELERIAARRSELDALAEELAKTLQEVQAEGEELVRAKMTKLADRGWLHERGDGRFTARP
ncbi:MULTISPECIES: hypothetical protein [Streptomyces]|uniref:Uncharacterized protein n=1 Tax=Streptomyces yunnanensis TaxID=156453 RepID=A0ABY7ZZ94_9ACTN|nr:MULTISPECIES: hypothetical protein [Streptomyces]WEB37933.1 hypothetical protein MOV08_00400 [Streptomyces yunnanensis]WEB45493.1 hypothetical protein MOV08_43580 [Streptomyces yunnanensis]